MRLSAKSIALVLTEFFELTIIFTFVAIFLYFAVGQLLEVTGDSMYPTFKDKEQLVAEKLSIKYSEIKRGDIVIVEHPKEKDVLIIKRVVALPGDSFKIQNGQLYINGGLLEEPYLAENTTTSGGQFLKDNVIYNLDRDNYIVLGDNREKSTDSRYWGYLDKKQIVGRAFVVYHPLRSFRFVGIRPAKQFADF